MPISVKNMSQSDEVRHLPKATVEMVNMNGSVVSRITCEPGWKWTESFKPTVGTESCEVSHLCYIISGRMKVVMDDGDEGEMGPGDVAQITPRHRARVVSSDPCVMIDFGGDAEYGKA